METTTMGFVWGLNRGYIGIMQKKMETTIYGLGFRVYGVAYSGVPGYQG